MSRALYRGLRGHDTQYLIYPGVEETPRKNCCGSTDQANMCHPRESGVECTRPKDKGRYQAELSLEPLVWTRGRNMPLDTRGVSVIMLTTRRVRPNRQTERAGI